jgi:integrase/recombinase XerD
MICNHLPLTTHESANADPHGMSGLLDKFLDALRVKNFSDETVHDRRVYASWFIQWAEQRGLTKPGEITKPILERYQRYLFNYRKRDGEPLSVSSQHHHMVVLRVWFKWLARNNHILYNPACDIELPKLESRLPKFVLTAREVERVLAQPDLGTPAGVRDRAMLETFYSTGMRRKELMRLCVYDIDAERGTAMIRQGKGNKDRMVPIGDRALAWIDRYLTEVRPALLIGDAASHVLFLTNLGQPFTPGQLTERVRRLVDAADLGKTGSCHLFRHAMATLMLENGADIRYIQAMLGHARLTTTQIYTQVSIKLLKAVHSATHPAKLKRAPDTTHTGTATSRSDSTSNSP